MYIALLLPNRNSQHSRPVNLFDCGGNRLSLKHWIDSAEISDGYLLRGITGNGLNLAMDPGQVSRTFKSLAVRAKLDPVQISGHSTRIGAAQDLLDSGASIGQIMAKVGWSKVDTVMRYVGAGDLSAINSEANYR